MSDYKPNADILTRYAEVLVHSGLGHSKGITPGDVVLVDYNQAAMNLVPHLARSILAAGGHPLWEGELDYPIALSAEEVLREIGTSEQLDFFPLEQHKTAWKLAQHRLTLKSNCFVEASPLAGTAAAKRRREVQAEKSVVLDHFRKEVWQSYTLAYYPTEAMAATSGVDLATFWQVISDGCFLGEGNAVELVRESNRRAAEVAEHLQRLEIQSLVYEGDELHLEMEIVPRSLILSSNGGNLPSYEVFFTPVAKSVNGWFRSHYPSLFEKELIDQATFRFEQGRCVEADAEVGNDALQRMREHAGMDFFGEAALTDRRLSRIKKSLPGWPLPMENIGGTGHFAFGRPVSKCIPKGVGPGANESREHLDFVCDGSFTVTATLGDGSSQVIWKDGEFTFF